MKDMYDKMPFDQKVSFLIDNLRSLPDELAEPGIEALLQAGEVEYAAVLARDKGLIKRAIEILVDEGDYLWAALIAKNAGWQEESDRLYREGLGYYIDMEMYGHAVSAATALKLPQEEIDGLFMKGVEVESRGMDLENTQAILDYAMESLACAIMGKDDDLSCDVMAAINRERESMAKRTRKDKEQL